MNPSQALPMTLKLAIVGAGPAGLSLALLAARALPQAQIHLFDARPLERDVSGDPRTLALSLGSVQLLERLGAWNATAQPILAVHVSQAPPTLSSPLFGASGEPEVHITAAEQGVDKLGAVLSYGHLVAPLQAAWLKREEPRLVSRFGTPVTAIKPVPGGVEIDAGIVENFDLAVVAEGGVFSEQARKALTHDYKQNAWVGTVTLDSSAPAGMAFERFTRNGPLALLPLPSPQNTPGAPRRAALIWCMPQDEDEIAGLSDAQRLTVIQTLLPSAAGRLLSISPLKCFPLGLNAEKTLVDGRVIRIGNAAQTLHPVAGQGLNLGLRDAWSLVEALKKSSNVDSALRSVEWQRGPDRWAMIAATDFLARSFAWRWPGLPAARGLGLAAVQALPIVRKVLAKRMMFGLR